MNDPGLIISVIVLAGIICLAAAIFRGHITLIAGINDEMADNMTSEQRRYWSLVGGFLVLFIAIVAAISVFAPMLIGD